MYNKNMNNFTKEELQEALRSIISTNSKCEKVLPKLKPDSSQYTLLTRRIKSFHISAALIEKELASLNNWFISPDYKHFAPAPSVPLLASEVSFCGEGEIRSRINFLTAKNFPWPRLVCPCAGMAPTFESLAQNEAVHFVPLLPTKNAQRAIFCTGGELIALARTFFVNNS